jgi:hypothetical protein
VKRSKAIRNLPLVAAAVVTLAFDTDPPSETSRRNDFGINTSLGWSFK